MRERVRRERDRKSYAGVSNFPGIYYWGGMKLGTQRFSRVSAQRGVRFRLSTPPPTKENTMDNELYLALVQAFGGAYKRPTNDERVIIRYTR